MRKFAEILILSLIITACGGSSTETSDEKSNAAENSMQENFVLNGQVSGAANTPFYIEAATNRGIILIGKSTSDGNGSFAINGNIQGYGEYYLRMGENNQNVVPMVIVPGDKISFASTSASFVDSSKFAGTTWSETATLFVPEYQKYAKSIAELRSSGGTMSEFEQLEASIAAKKPLEEFAFDRMKANLGDPYNLILFKIAGPAFDNFIGWDPKNVSLFAEVYEALEKQHPNSPIIRAMGMQVQEMTAMLDVVNGEIEAPEIALPNPSGKEMKLSDLRGKYVLVDFWASWCGPCRRENPNVKRIYNTYKNKGFTIFSVSLDENASNWKMAIEKDGLDWPYHVSDLKKWESPLPQIYGFDGIPFTVLVNKEGKIIAKGLRGATLEWKLKELL